MKPLDPQSRRLIDEVTASEAATPELQERLWESLSQRLQQPLPPTAAAAASHMRGASQLHASSSPLLKLVIGVFVVGAATASVVQVRRHNAVTSVTPQLRPSPSVSSAPPLSEAAPAAKTALADATGDGTLAAETALLARAQRALRSGDPSAALPIIDEHAARFPRGELAQERDAARVFALCAMKHTPEARRAQQQFLRSWPRSPLAARVEGACGKPAP